MKCDKCKINPVNVVYSENINGNKTVVHLCSECAEKSNLEFNHFSLNSKFFGDFFDVFDEHEIAPLSLAPTYNFEQLYKNLSNAMFYGSPKGYDMFQDKLSQMIGRVSTMGEKTQSQENNEKDTEKKKVRILSGINEVQLLKERLLYAIKEERFEDAAKLRDEIKKIEEK